MTVGTRIFVLILGRPKIRSTPLWIVAAACGVALVAALAAAFALETYTDANMALGDASILALSVVAGRGALTPGARSWPNSRVN